MPSSSEPLPVEDLGGLLSHSFKNGLQIKNMEWKPLTDPGENFGSIIIAINLDVVQKDRKETLNLVCKLPPKTTYLIELFNSPLTFKKELYFYDRLAPEIINVQLESGIKPDDVSTIVPRFYGGRLGRQDPEKFDEQAAIIMENLKCAGYTIRDRIDGLDKKHMEYAINELAKLHAIIICLKTRQPEFFEKIGLQVLEPPVDPSTKSCVFDMINKAFEDIKNIEEAKPYLERVDKTIQYGNEQEDSYVPEEPWATLVHSDFWVNNMMFRYDKSSNISDMKIVDFQLCMYDYGVNDLIFFVISSAKKEIIDSDLDYMIELYYDCFIKCLRSLNMDTEKFPKSKYMEIVNYCGPIKFKQCIMMVQVIQANRGAAPKLESINSKEAFLNIEGGNTKREKLLHILSVFDRKGWLLR